jgi:hypothetical protein
MQSLFDAIMPAKAGIQLKDQCAASSWTPAFAGVTILGMELILGSGV